MTELAIVIVNHNTRAELEGCLRSLHAHPPLRSYDTILVDNASSDGSVEAVRAAWPDVRVIEAGGNLGFARANNLAIRASASELILLLNSDTLVTAGAVDVMVEALRAHDDVAIVGPRLVDEHGVIELSFGCMIGPFTELGQKLLGLGHSHGRGLLSSYLERRARRGHCPDWVSGACLLVRRGDAEAVGLLDERFFMYGEDVDFCAAVRRLGRRVLFTPAAQIVHLRGRSTRAARGATEAAYRRSQLAFYAKHRRHWVGPLRLYLRLRGKLPSNRGSGAGVRSRGLHGR